MKHTKGQSMPDGTIQYYKDAMGRAMVSTDYDPTSSYAVGDYCIYDNVRYCCNTAIASGGETWNSAHWDVAKVDDDITEINSALTELETATLLHTFTAVDSTGVTVDFTPYRAALVAVFDTTWGFMATSYYPISIFLDANNHWARSLWGNSVVSGSVRYVNDKLQCLYLENGGLSNVSCRVYGIK